MCKVRPSGVPWSQSLQLDRFRVVFVRCSLSSSSSLELLFQENCYIWSANLTRKISPRHWANPNPNIYNINYHVNIFPDWTTLSLGGTDRFSAIGCVESRSTARERPGWLRTENPRRSAAWSPLPFWRCWKSVHQSCSTQVLGFDLNSYYEFLTQRGCRTLSRWLALPDHLTRTGRYTWSQAHVQFLFHNNILFYADFDAQQTKENLFLLRRVFVVAHPARLIWFRKFTFWLCSAGLEQYFMIKRMRAAVPDVLFSFPSLCCCRIVCSAWKIAKKDIDCLTLSQNT